jgi:hypothetical protein
VLSRARVGAEREGQGRRATDLRAGPHLEEEGDLLPGDRRTHERGQARDQLAQGARREKNTTSSLMSKRTPLLGTTTGAGGGLSAALSPAHLASIHLYCHARVCEKPHYLQLPTSGTPSPWHNTS